MNLSQLYYFKKLAEIGHYTKAAKELFITQPALSDSISGLEKELGAVLFHKEKKSIVLTRIGREFYTYVCLSLNQLDTGIAILKEKTSYLSGVVDLGSIPTLLNEFVPEAVYDYKKDINPLVNFNIHSGHTDNILAKLISEEIDLGFCAKKPDETELAFVPVLYQPYVALAAKQHPLASERSITLDKLKNYNLLSYRKNLIIYQDLEKYIKKTDLTVSCSYDDEISIGGMVSAGDSVGIVANTPYLRLFGHLVSVPIVDIPINAHTIYMAYKKKKYIAKNIESFANYVVAKKISI